MNPNRERFAVLSGSGVSSPPSSGFSLCSNSGRYFCFLTFSPVSGFSSSNMGSRSFLRCFPVPPADVPRMASKIMFFQSCMKIQKRPEKMRQSAVTMVPIVPMQRRRIPAEMFSVSGAAINAPRAPPESANAGLPLCPMPRRSVWRMNSCGNSASRITMPSIVTQSAMM